MPSVSKKQHNFMAAVANNPSFAKKADVPQSVGKEFNQADKGRKFSKGGDTMASKMNPGFMAMMAKKKAAPAKKMASGGSANMNVDKLPSLNVNTGKSNAPSQSGRTIPTSSSWSSQSPKVNPGGAGKVYASGMAKKTTSDVNKVNPGGAGKVYASGTAKKMAGGGCAKMARGGGIEKKGKTKGKMC